MASDHAQPRANLNPNFPITTQASRRLKLSLRTHLMRAVTLAPHDIVLGRRAALRARPGVGALVGAAERWYASGVVAFSPVVGAELLLDASTAPITHVQVGDLVRGELETPVQEAFRRRLRAGDVVFDVGANVGFLTLVAGAIVGSGGRVVAWEPVPESADAIRRNAALNDMGWVQVREAAAGAEAGTQTLLEVDERSWSHLADRGRHPRTQSEREVRVEALDALVLSGELPPPRLVKIDVEGSEVAVLPGMRRLLSDYRPDLVVELHGTNAEVADLLEPLGYALENLDGPAPVREAGPVHVLAIPRS
ncbi:MAG: FkbM family methyltransferase [Solirubrobacterales bacterium]|nr:FkbM family methyltransferase [Solirubrobacterales bacterium]